MRRTRLTQNHKKLDGSVGQNSVAIATRIEQINLGRDKKKVVDGNRERKKKAVVKSPRLGQCELSSAGRSIEN